MPKRSERKRQKREVKAAIEAAATQTEAVESKEPRTAEQANAELSQTARVINMKERMAKQKKTEKADAKRSAHQADQRARTNLTPTGKLPPIPRLYKKKPKPLKPCECGCGGTTKARFVPGHDSRLKGWIRRIDMDIIKIGDIPDGQRQAVQKALKQREAERNYRQPKSKKQAAANGGGETTSAVQTQEAAAVEAPKNDE